MTEIRALRQNAGSKPAEPVRCAVASVKANIGHTLAAAGIASIIKCVVSTVVPSHRRPACNQRARAWGWRAPDSMFQRWPNR